MSFHVLFKTTCKVNSRVYYGIHMTNDIFFGTDMATDFYIGDTADIAADAARYGKNAFVVESIHAYDDADKAHAALAEIRKKLPPNAYNTRHSAAKMGNDYALGAVRSLEVRQRISEVTSGENNPMYGKKHKNDTIQQMSEFRKQMLWINNGLEEQQIPKSDPIPTGWSKGRKPKKIAKNVIAAANSMSAATESANQSDTDSSK